MISSGIFYQSQRRGSAQPEYIKTFKLSIPSSNKNSIYRPFIIMRYLEDFKEIRYTCIHIRRQKYAKCKKIAKLNDISNQSQPLGRFR